VAKSSVIAAITNVKQCISQVRWRVRCLSQMTASDINRPSSTLLITLESNHANSSVNPQTSTSHLCLRKALLSDDCVIRSANRQCRCSRRRLELGLPGSERYSTISRFDRIWDRDVARRLKVCLWGGGYVHENRTYRRPFTSAPVWREIRGPHFHRKKLYLAFAKMQFPAVWFTCTLLSRLLADRT